LSIVHEACYLFLGKKKGRGGSKQHWPTSSLSNLRGSKKKQLLGDTKTSKPKKVEVLSLTQENAFDLCTMGRVP
jgi:hypothetical protein